MVYQDLALADNLDVAGNIFLGRELGRPLLGQFLRLLSRRHMEARTYEILKLLQIEIASPRQKVRYLSGGQRQAVAVGRTILAQARLVIMDEPTAALGVAEVEKVLGLIRRLKEQGIAVVFITHRLPHIFAVADRIIVLRGGYRVGTLDAHETSIDEVTKLIVGKRIEITVEGEARGAS
jgi:simple sugar transport system ATP-binding protein